MVEKKQPVKIIFEPIRRIQPKRTEEWRKNAGRASQIVWAQEGFRDYMRKRKSGEIGDVSFQQYKLGILEPSENPSLTNQEELFIPSEDFDPRDSEQFQNDLDMWNMAKEQGLIERMRKEKLVSEATLEICAQYFESPVRSKTPIWALDEFTRVFVNLYK